MPRGKALLLLVVASLAGLAGMSRIDKNVDLLEMLPAGLRQVEGLRIYRKHFVREEELVVAVSGSEASEVAAAAGSLAAHLLNAGSGVIRNARWRESGGGDAGDLADLAAYAWLNAPPENVSDLVSRLSPGEVANGLAASMEDLALTQDARELALLQYDPFRLLEFPGSEGLLEGLGEQASAFASGDGRFRLIFLECPDKLESRADIVTWMRAVRKLVDDWEAAHPAKSSAVNLALTGEAALQTETIDGMQRDLTGSVIGTSLAVALLFFLMHRRMLPLVLLTAALSVSLVVACGFAALTYGELSAMSAGFAAIIIALVADYGVLVWQEGKSGGMTGRALLSEIGPSIFWAALTTAAVFFGLNLSSFPGIAQLGNLVGAGILAGAAIITLFYLPVISGLLDASKGNGPAPRPARPIRSRGRWPKIVASLILTSCVVFATLGLPPLNESYWALRPRNSSALEAVEEILEKMPPWAEARLPVIVTGDNGDDKAVDVPWTRFQQVERAGRELGDAGQIDGLFIPACLWPDRDRQRSNLAVLTPLLGGEERYLSGLAEAGFGGEAGMFLSRILEIWRKAERAGPAASAPCLPGDLGGDWPVILGKFVSHGEGGANPVLLGRIIPREDTVPGKDTFAALRQLEIDGVYLTGWDSLHGATWPLMLHDFRWVLAPMAFVLLAMLTIVYRNIRHIAATVGIMVLGWMFLVALMTLLAQLRATSPAFAWLPVCEWNFMNLAAIPLLMGTGLDYAIHITLSVNRHRGDLGLVRQRTGKAVILCGLSTAAGFGSLAFASNRGLSSLGTVCCLGILITTALAVVVLPRVLVLRAGVSPTPREDRAGPPG